MLFKLFGEIVDRHADVIHTDCGQSFYIVVNDCLASDFEKRFRSCQCHRAQAFTLASGHQHSAHRKHSPGQTCVNHSDHPALIVKHRNQSYAPTADRADLCRIYTVLLQSMKPAEHGRCHRSIKSDA